MPVAATPQGRNQSSCLAAAPHMKLISAMSTAEPLCCAAGRAAGCAAGCAASSGRVEAGAALRLVAPTM
eukprot:scaffold10949_cov67-Phaeocystis_antarctica.AAC.4